MMLRGCKLKNTGWVAGIVVYTGVDTAIMMNGSQPFTKTSNIERTLNKYILSILVFEILCAAGSAIYCYFSCTQTYLFEKYIHGGSAECGQIAAITFATYFLLYSTFIPISLIVSLEFVKVFQGYFMSKDKEMFCGINQRELECHTVSIN